MVQLERLQTEWFSLIRPIGAICDLNCPERLQEILCYNWFDLSSVYQEVNSNQLI